MSNSYGSLDRKIYTFFRKFTVEWLKVTGRSTTVGAEIVDVLTRNADGDIMGCSGLTKPTDTTDGYAKGCTFVKTDAAAGTKSIYENTGTKDSCVFNLAGEEVPGDIVLATNSTLVGVGGYGSALAIAEARVLGRATGGNVDSIQLTNEHMNWSGGLSMSGNTGVCITLTPAAAGAGLKIHTHFATGATRDYANELKGETVRTSGFYDGLALDYKLAASGTAILRAIRGTAELSAGFSMTGADYTTQSWLAGGVFQASVSGTINGAGVVIAGVVGAIGSNNGGTLTQCKYMAAVWADWASLVELGTGSSAIILATVGEGAGGQIVDYGIRIVTAGLVTTGISISGATTTGISIADATLSISASKTFTSQTTENKIASLSLVTDSTFLDGGNDITYSGSFGSSILKMAGTWTGASGGFEGIDLKIATSGALAAAADGVIGIKVVVTNTAALADGSIYGGQFIAKHNHATSDMTAQATLCGLEAIAYNALGGDVGTAIGMNVVMRNYGAGGGGSCHRGLQIVLDQAGGTKATEATGICIWNMAGTWDAVMRISGAFTSLVNFVDATTCYAVITNTPTTIAGQILVTMPNGSPGYVIVYSGTGS